MNVTIYVEPSQAANSVLPLVRSTVEAEITRLELALEMAQKRLAPFEQRYQVASEKLMASLTAEDLDGGDDEYVTWAGEYSLKERLQTKLQQLQAVRYGHPELLQQN